MTQQQAKTLYDPEFDHDSCGFGLIVNLNDLPSHWVIETAISALSRLTHRGAIAADGKTGDGCGLLIKFPESFLRAVGEQLGFELRQRFAAGSVFLSQDGGAANVAREIIGQAIAEVGLELAGCRQVPLDPSACGERALATMPRIEQVFVNVPDGMPRGRFNRRLFLARRRAENRIADAETYIASLSSVTISYKGMVMPAALPDFYPDLKDRRLESSVCIFHQRFSTNTLPEWRLAQPSRFLAHNGEINTIQGNRNWAQARARNFISDKLDDISDLDPIISLRGSDSSSLDNMLEVMRAGGMDVIQAMRILMPPAWQTADNIDPDVRAFYEFFDYQIEPWDGPAGIVLTDGRYAVCCLDRNGLRPARYVITVDRHLTIASEIGVYDYEETDVISKGRLGPGEMLAVDLVNGTLLDNDDIHDILKTRAPYKKWLKKGVRYLDSQLVDTKTAAEPMQPEVLASYQKMFNLTREELGEIVAVLARDEIDPLRERIVMSLQTNIGREMSLFDIGPAHAEQVLINSPVLSQAKLRQLLGPGMFENRHAFIDLNVDAELTLPQALDQLCEQAEQEVRDGNFLLMLSDRYLQEDKLPVHALLATGAVHHHLVNVGLRCDANIIVETAVARDSHHFACLIGYGATLVYPYLVYQCLHDIGRRGNLAKQQQLGRSYRRGIRKGLFKIISKMGISTISSYRGAQLFEIVGLDEAIVERCFAGTTSRIQGANFDDLIDDQRQLAAAAWEPRVPISQGGLLKYVHGGEYHCFNPDVVTTLHAAVRSGDFEVYKKYAKLINERPIATLRDLLQIKPAGPAVPLQEVESVEDVLVRFDSAGMSLGALSPEAHEALAIAMNRMGARSNSGEGGEDPARYGTERSSKIKQIASGRFGVTAEYLVNAEVIQIKIAQGAKPGEGGQLPGHKVNEMIAKLRCAKPGVVKAYADLITISGYDGGTGASSLSSVKYAGSPWELGLAETHQVLRAQDMRHRVRLQTDGGLKTGLDVIKAALLGAESFGFGTGPIMALGCKYLRICHLNNCATGVATQNKVLRSEYFIGLPEMVINFFRFIAAEVRILMAEMGVRSLEELIGRVDLLDAQPGETARQARLDLRPILSDGGQYNYTVKNFHRSIGARLAGEIARRHGNYGMADAPLDIRLTGTAGQSFGAWNVAGLNLSLIGDANDYVGKGMAGGRIVIHPPKHVAYVARDSVIIGNTCLYGATGGDLFAAGCAGERFAVRNSGASAVIEGAGDHCCEYMTGGVVVVLGRTGVNFGAGMTGGFAYVLDIDRGLVDRYNHELIDIHRITPESMEAHLHHLRSMIAAHVERTGSDWGDTILDDYRTFLPKFWVVKPKAAEIGSLIESLRRAA
ncbi:MAG: glutamate synthase large subunit [Proteobacteria bacterium]|nr:glutamate synthase large subunit [Pseudomonadota bacterium]